MGQQYFPIQQALDTQLLTTAGIAIWNPSAKTGNFIPENVPFSLAYVNNMNSQTIVRSTQINIAPETATIGVGGLDKVSGFYVVDVMGPLNTGYAAVKQLVDLVIASFPRGMIITLSNSNTIQIEKTGPNPNIQQGAWAMNKLYCNQVRVDWFGYMTAT